MKKLRVLRGLRRQIGPAPDSSPGERAFKPAHENGALEAA
jgi:hypothetical protein